MHKIIIIVAVDKNWAIGKNNDLIYSIPTDMKFFRETTKNNIVVYGYNTLLSFPNQNPLPKRDNVVITSRDIDTKDNLIVAHSIEDAINRISDIKDNRNVYICGGASIYKQFKDIADEAYVTKINAETKDATAFMFNLDKDNNWEIYDISESIFDKQSGLTIQFYKYKREDVKNEK